MNKTDVTIVIYGHDPLLLETRRLILTKSGFAPLSVADHAIAHEMIRHRDIDLLILCSSLPAEEKEWILAELRNTRGSEMSEIKTLVITQPHSNVNFSSTKVLPSPVAPKTFQSTVTTLVSPEFSGD